MQNEYCLEEGNLRILCRIIRSNRKTCSLEITKHGQVNIRIPVRMNPAQLNGLLQDKRNWIIKNYQKMQNKLAAQETGQEIDKDQISIARLEALNRRYRDAAQQYIPMRAAYYQQFLDVDYQKITIRDQKTRWGSCSSKGTLSFNFRLMLAPPPVLDYVVVHELCHLIHMNHSKDFWNAVGSIIPNYKESRKWLRDHGEKLMQPDAVFATLPVV